MDTFLHAVVKTFLAKVDITFVFICPALIMSNSTFLCKVKTYAPSGCVPIGEQFRLDLNKISVCAVKIGRAHV